MIRNRTNVLAIVAGVTAFALPVLLAWNVANQLALKAASREALVLSREVLRRTDETRTQVGAATTRLAAVDDTDPCSPRQIALMRQLDVASSYIQTVGAVADGKLICSSLGRHEPGLPLGPISYVSAQGSQVRTSVELEFAPGAHFTIVELHGFAAVIHHDLVTDVFTDTPDLTVGLFAVASKELIVSRGYHEQAWVDALGDAQESVTYYDDYLVAISRSREYDFAGFAAVPARNGRDAAREIALSLVPLGLLVGVLFLIPLFLLARRQNSLPSVIRTALKRGEFFLNYQPILDLRSGRCVGAEALIRWKRQDGTFMRPDLFIPVAEDSGQIRNITARVLQLLAKDAPTILAEHPDFQFSVNLSPADLQSPQILDELRALLATPAMTPANLHAEITERGMLNTDAVRGIVRDIRQLGIEVAIDDFGTGFCSLSYLTTFEMDYLKIDKAFVDTLGTTAATSQVAMHIIEMAKELNLQMIAEGVENAGQADILRNSGVQFVQGWLYAKAMSPPDLRAWLESPGHVR